MRNCEYQFISYAKSDELTSFKCDACKRDVTVSGVSAYNGGEIVGINIDTGDTAKLDNICTDAKVQCQLYDGPGTKAGEC